jgi:phytoene synthase
MPNDDLSFEDSIFKNGSKTYYNSSLFFPKQQRNDITKLYSFVRVVDNLVDNTPQQLDRFRQICKAYRLHKTFPSLNDEDIRVLNNIWSLETKYNFDKQWVESFLQSMEMDAEYYSYITLDDTLKYIHGSAEVIGLMMSAILGLNKASFPYASLQGRSMQYINLIRDVNEDIGLGRCYFPLDIRKQYGLETWDDSIKNNPEFNNFVKDEIIRYQKWQDESSLGWKYIPFKSRVAIKTAARMYNWTAARILDDPSIVFTKKVKPTKVRILLTGIYSIVL